MADFESTRELAERIGKSRSIVWLWITRGVVVGGTVVRLPARRIGKQWAIAPDEYESFTKACNPGKQVLPESPAMQQKRARREQARVARKLGGK